MVLKLLSEGEKFNLKHPVQTEAQHGQKPSHPQHQTTGTDGTPRCSGLLGYLAVQAIMVR